jgi:phosphatidylserine decarboxylase
VVRRLAQVRSRHAVERFAARYQLAIEEAEKPLEAYPSLLELFTRRLKPGLRPLDPDPAALLCPCDGRLYQQGPIEAGSLFQAKGRTFTLAALLGSEGRAAHYSGGSFITIYLSPKDYHRVHSPATGLICGYSYVPGDLYPVNPAAVAHVDALFARNERLITHLETPAFGWIEEVMVGATCVGHIRMAYDPQVATNTGGTAIREISYQPQKPITRGDEVGVFEMGSTVILILEPKVRLEPLQVDQPLKLGMRLGTRG